MLFISFLGGVRRLGERFLDHSIDHQPPGPSTPLRVGTSAATSESEGKDEG